uniref:GtrA-like protein domain-containing protein n=1 Tax=Romanomermis culicivorax TaxID=13658 RepID=A0A915KGP9_ROMCU
MLYRWFQNFAQMPLEAHYGDKQMREIPAPYLEYCMNNTLHTTHFGVIMGSIVVPCSIKAYDYSIKWRKISKFWSKTGICVECYRARYDKKQLFIDRGFVTSFAIGFLFNRWYSLAEFVGITTAFTLFYNRFLWHKFARIFRDLVEIPPESDELN